MLDASSGRLLQTLDWPHRHPEIITFSSDGKQLALADGGDFERNVAVWDLTSGKLCHVFDRFSYWGVNGMAFSPDSRLLAVGTQVIQVWDLSSGKCLSADFVGHEPDVGHVVFLGQSDTVATAGGEDAIRLWEARTGRQKLLIRPESMLVEDLAASPDGKLLASPFDDGKASSVRIWDAKTGKRLHEFAGGAKKTLRLGFSADGKRLAGVGDDGKARVWSVESRTLLSENGLQMGPSGPKDEMMLVAVRNAVFSPDGRFLVVGFGKGSRVLSVETGKELQTFGTGGPKMSDMAISADGKLLLSNDYEHQLRLWELPKGKEIWRQDLPFNGWTPLAISADGKRFAVCLRGASPEIRVCGLANHETLQTLKNVGHPRCLSFSPDGRLLVAGMEDGSAVTWDVSQPPSGR